MESSLLQKTIYNEARGEGEIGMRAVASTIKNRASMNRNYLGGSDLDSICSQGDDGAKKGANPVSPEDRNAWEIAGRIAEEMRSGHFQPTNNYTHFATSRDSFRRMEGPKFTYERQIGNHHFFRER